MRGEWSGLLRYMGHFHPVLVHLPIGFIVLLSALEALAFSPRLRHLRSSSRTILMLTVPAVWVTVVCGWLLSLGGGYDRQLLVWHKWLGTSLAAAVVILLWLHWRGRLQAYRVGLFLTLGLLTVTGHLGGSLTHGSDYLNFRVVMAEGKPHGPGDVMAQPVFPAVIQPIFAAHCVACHGSSKSKGSLRLNTYANLMHGGYLGPAIVPDNAEQSRLIQRLLLPLHDHDHMPPAGKAQPTKAQIALLEWWIDAGAPRDKTLQGLHPPQSVLDTVAGAHRSTSTPTLPQNQ